MKKKNYSLWTAIFLVLIPSVLLFYAGLRTYLGINILDFVPNYISTWPLAARVVFFNCVFFLFPVISIFLGLRNYKKNKFWNTLVVILSALVILWYGIHLAYD